MSNSSKILILSTEFPPGPGGIGTHAYEISRQLSMIGWKVYVAACQDYTDSDERDRFNKNLSFKISALESSRGIFTNLIGRWLCIKKLMTEFKPDCILATGDRMLYLASGLSGKTPWVGVEHGRIVSGFEGLIKKWAFKKSAHIVFVSEYTKKRNVEAGFFPKRSSVIPNGADENFFKILDPQVLASFKKKYDLNETAKILLTVGNVTERKGQEIVIRALPEIMRRYPNVIYVMAGLPTIQIKLEQLARELNVAENVLFLGKVDKETLLQAINACDVFLMTSRQSSKGDFEGYGIAAVEAALCGKPAIVTGDSGLAEAIQEGVTGFGVPQNDVAGVTRAVFRLLDDGNLCEQMGVAARKRALSEQTWKIRAKAFHELLLPMVGKT